MKRAIVYSVVAVVLALGGFGIYKYVKSKGKGTWKFDTVAVDKGTIVQKVTASGTLSATVTVTVGAQVSGRITEIDKDYNSPVKKGDILAKIDPSSLQAQLESTNANYAAAIASLGKAKTNAANLDIQLRRQQELFDKKLVAASDLDSAKAAASVAHADIDSASASVQQAEAQVHQAQANVSYTTITSPVDGIVISRAIDVGQTVASALSAPTLFTIAQDLTKMQVDTSVAESDVGKLGDKMAVTFTVDAWPGVNFPGEIYQIRNAATTVQNVVTYDAVVSVSNKDLKLKPGMTANVTFVVAQKDDAIRVPNSALRFRPPAALAPPKSGRNGSGAGPAGSAKPVADGTPAGSAAGSFAGGHKHRADGGPGDATLANVAPTGSAASSGAPALDDTSSAAPVRHRGGVGGMGLWKSDDPTSDRKVLYTVVGGKLNAIPVQTGITDGAFTEILKGEVHEGDLVVTDAYGGDSAAPSPTGQGNQQKPGGGGGGGGGMKRIF